MFSSRAFNSHTAVHIMYEINTDTINLGGKLYQLFPLHYTVDNNDKIAANVGV